jgi:dTDP-4-amino-4,6-dideoxygalactose transaminase
MADKIKDQSFLPFARPEIGEEEVSAVCEVLRSGWITTGAKAKQLEEDFNAFLGGGLQCLAVNSATAGLHLALEALGIGPGDEVITTTLTFTATAEVVRYLGADPVFVDVDPMTLNLDARLIPRAITSRTKAILVVHYGGLACDMDAIFRIAAAQGLKVVEDAAHALPATWKGRQIGCLASDVTVFSFYANKSITTGEGGMIVTSHPALAARMRVMRLHGMSRDAFDRFNSRVPAWYYEIVAPGFKYNLTDIAAAMGIEQLRKLPRFLLRRQELAIAYFRALRELPLILPARAPDGEVHSWHLYVIRLSDVALGRGNSRDQVIDTLSALGVGTSVHYVPLHRQPYWCERYALRPEQFPVADHAYQTMLTIPLYTAMSNDDLTRVVAALSKALE